MGGEVSEWFGVKVWLMQVLGISQWLFNLYMEGMVREVNARTFGSVVQMV